MEERSLRMSQGFCCNRFPGKSKGHHHEKKEEEEKKAGDEEDVFDRLILVLHERERESVNERVSQRKRRLNLREDLNE